MTFKRIIGISDIHGCFYLCVRLIERIICFNPEEDQLVFLGDYIDFRSMTDKVDRKGISSKMVVKYVSILKEKHPENIILLKGNHEAMAEKYFLTGDPNILKMWIHNGADETHSSFGDIKKAREILVPFIKTLRLFHESSAYIFVHGGISDNKALYPPDEQGTLRQIEYGTGEKPLVVGHSVVDAVSRSGNKLYTDLGAFVTGRLAAYDVMNDRIYEAVADTPAVRK